ncbi:MAG TPA: hypothetical protein VIR56_01060 [Solimonas sp.]
MIKAIVTDIEGRGGKRRIALNGNPSRRAARHGRLARIAAPWTAQELL